MVAAPGDVGRLPRVAIAGRLGRRSVTTQTGVIGRMTDASRRRPHTLPAMDMTVGSVRSPLLIGRDGLLELVDRRLDDVEVGRGQFLLIGGMAGIGKTRLLSAIGRKARERGFAESRGRIVAPGS